jgi:aspartyl protease family protein
MRFILFFTSFLFILDINIQGQELNVEQTIQYITKELNETHNKHSLIRVWTFVSRENLNNENYDRVQMDDYKYQIKVEDGYLIIDRTFLLKKIPRIIENWTVQITEIRNDSEGIEIYTIPASMGSKEEEISFLNIRCKDLQKAVKKISTEYSKEGIEVDKKTEKSDRLPVNFSNDNLIDKKLRNAFAHLIDLISNDSNYYLSNKKNDDPFEKSIVSDTANTNSILTIKSNSIPMKKVGGVYEIPILINGVLKLDFIFDAGAADVSISPDVALTLIRTGTVSNDDFLGTEIYKFGDGSTAKSETFMLKEIQIGNKKVTNVKASISKSIKAPLLLGQSVLNRFGKVTIDYKKGMITFQD